MGNSKSTQANEPAFPNEVIDPHFGAKMEGGLTKREYFAAMAIQGLLAGDWSGDYADLTKNAVNISDNLLKHLEK